MTLTSPTLLARGLAIAASAVIHGPRAPLSQLIGEANVLAPRIEAFMAADWDRLRALEAEADPVPGLREAVQRTGQKHVE